MGTATPLVAGFLRLAPFLALLAVLTLGCGGQPGNGGEGGSTITGSVVDAGDVTQGIPDTYVYVPISSGGRARQAAGSAPVAEAHTSSDGSYTLTGVPAGLQTIVVEPPAGSGYAGMQIDLEIPENAVLRGFRITLPRLNADIASIVIAPADEFTLGFGATQQFSATVLDSTGADVGLTPVWTTTGGVGTIGAGGLFTAGNTTASGQVVAMLGDKVAMVPVHVREVVELSGTILYADLNNSQSDICVVSADEGAPVVLETTSSIHEAFPVWSPDGARIAFYRTDLTVGDLWVMNADGSGRANLTNTPDDDAEYYNHVWAPDGQSLALSVQEEDGAVLVRADTGGGTERLTEYSPSVNDYSPDWSPDGRRIAFTRGGSVGDSSESRICVVGRDGGDVSVITPEGGADELPRWRPDGTRLAFVRVTPDMWVQHLWLMEPDGAGATDLMSASPLSAREQRWSPDGSQLALLISEWHEEDYTSRDGVALISASGGDVTVLASLPPDEWGQSLAWSPDGRRISFMTNVAIYVVSASGGTPVARVTFEGFPNGSMWSCPNWFPG